jgi:asparagine synthase (glutamine-hydrolysing)
MSLQFGRWNFEDLQPNQDYVNRVEKLLARYEPDTNESYAGPGITILYRAFHTTRESRRETQPLLATSGVVTTWDGRLDNRAELIAELRNTVAITSTDVEIVSAAYERWGSNCFGKLMGDWALSIFNSTERSLILAKDPIGLRHLYYAFDHKQIIWSTVLDPLVVCAEKPLKICEEYVAGWLSAFPATHLTPYLGIHAVPPSSCVLLGPGKRTVRKYWDFDPYKKIRYRTDAEYEEHFRSVFARAIQRRLRCDTPVLAELSGGRDSSSIVCMADEIISRGNAETPRLDTISYYNDSEPNWNERPYFQKVEEKRSRTGWHIDVSLQDSQETLLSETGEFPDLQLAPAPGPCGRTSEQIRMCLASQGNRVLLSGIGGDEVMGGVPIPVPELQDLLARGRLVQFLHQLKIWALQKRRPWFRLFLEVVLGFFPPSLVGVSKHIRPASWLQQRFVSRHWVALSGYPSRMRLFGPLPSFQDNLSTLDGLRRQMASKPLRSQEPYEKRYPFLDLNLLEFMYAIPREQSVRPAQRRSLMRRALVCIVPSEILNRKRKATVVRAPLLRLCKDSAALAEMKHPMLSSSLGIVDSEQFSCALWRAKLSEETHFLPLIRAIHIEAWLRNLHKSGIMDFDSSARQEFTFKASATGQ